MNVMYIHIPNTYYSVYSIICQSKEVRSLYFLYVCSNFDSGLWFGAFLRWMPQVQFKHEKNIYINIFVCCLNVPHGNQTGDLP